MQIIARVFTVAAFAFLSIGSSVAAEMKVFCTIGVQAAMEQLVPGFEHASGNKLAITFGTAAILVKKVQAGETADVLILTRQGLDELAGAGKAAVGSNANFANSGMSMVVRKGAVRPDISTPEAFRQTLLSAKTIAYSNPAFGGASGVYFAKLLERMGIAEQVKAKTRHPPASGNAANLVATGEVELAVQQEPEVISVVGVDLVGNLPPEINNITVYAAGVGAGTAQGAGAAALITFLHSPEAVAMFKTKGLHPE